MCPERHLFPLFLGNIMSKRFFQWTDTGKQMSLQIVPSDSTSARDTREFIRDSSGSSHQRFSPKRPNVGIYCIYNFSRSW